MNARKSVQISCLVAATWPAVSVVICVFVPSLLNERGKRAPRHAQNPASPERRQGEGVGVCGVLFDADRHDHAPGFNGCGFHAVGCSCPHGDGFIGIKSQNNPFRS